MAGGGVTKAWGQKLLTQAGDMEKAIGENLGLKSTRNGYSRALNLLISGNEKRNTKENVAKKHLGNQNN